ncbi:MAG: hypothetical protein ACKVU2_17160 [Saprospiraceae bacterium]
MKSVSVTRSLFPRTSGKFTAATLALLLFFASSCQKDAEPILPVEASAPVQVTMRSGEMDLQVIAHIQWLINNVLPLAADEAVAAALQAGNTTSPELIAKLQTLGFANFEQFAQALNTNGSAVQAAISSGSLTQAMLLQIGNTAEFDFSGVMWATSALPCTDELADNLLLVPIYIAAAAAGGPWVAAIAGAIQVVVAYTTFKRCLKSTYPGGVTP